MTHPTTNLTPGEVSPAPLSTSATPLSVGEIAATGHHALDSVNTAEVGMRDTLRLALAAVLAGGHVLFEDVPGLGKTLAARSLAGALGLSFRRLQCTPALLPGDMTGAFVWNP